MFIWVRVSFRVKAQTLPTSLGEAGPKSLAQGPNADIVTLLAAGFEPMSSQAIRIALSYRKELLYL